MQVTVHSLGAIASTRAKLAVRDRAGKTVATAPIPPLPAPTDLLPKTTTIKLHLPNNPLPHGGTVTIESNSKIPEITQLNNQVEIPGGPE